jgi:hypothetical protein
MIRPPVDFQRVALNESVKDHDSNLNRLMDYWWLN